MTLCYSHKLVILPMVRLFYFMVSIGLKTTEEMVGHKFEEFASTWKPSSYRKRAYK